MYCYVYRKPCPCSGVDLSYKCNRGGLSKSVSDRCKIQYLVGYSDVHRRMQWNDEQQQYHGAKCVWRICIDHIYGDERLRTESNVYSDVYSKPCACSGVDLPYKCNRSCLSDASTNRYKIQYVVGHCDVHRRLQRNDE